MMSKAESHKKYPYVGLYNLGATCYMNSLLQALYNTPEFKYQLFKWKYNKSQHTSPPDCIPLQLQKLFAKMLLGNTSYVDTRDLAKSFQWNEADSFQEHDAQEFCNVLFSAIEQSLVACTEGDPDFLTRLFEITLSSHVQCLLCHRVSSREEVCREFQLSLCSPDQAVSYDSIEMALNAYFVPEKLEGREQYACGECGKKVDALKYSKVSKLPSVLSLHLKRFTYDLNTGSRIKLNHTMTFPLTLNMNYYLKYFPLPGVARCMRPPMAMKCPCKSSLRPILCSPISKAWLTTLQSKK